MSCCDNRVLVTGATGLIGRELLMPLLRAGFDVHAVSRYASCATVGCTWHQGSLFDESFVKRLVKEVRPSHLLNLAWCTTGDYLTSNLNLGFLEAGKCLSRCFAENGGRRAVYAGTCFEYKFGDLPLREDGKLDVEKTLYTKCKDLLRRYAEQMFLSSGVSFAYGRIFYVYGCGESNMRLAGMVVDRLSRGVPVVIKAGSLRKDYVYTKDIAEAFVALLRSTVDGPVNICTAQAVRIRDFVMTIAMRMERPDLVSFADDCADQPPIIVGDNGRLVREVGYQPHWTLDAAVDEMVLSARGSNAFHA